MSIVPADPPTPGELDSLVTHVAYEYATLEIAHQRWPGDRLAFEAFLVHARALRDFLWEKWEPCAQHADKVVLAVHYFRDPTVWAKGGMPATLGRVKDALDQQLAHIARGRVNGTVARDLEAAAPEIFKEIQRGWRRFIEALDDGPRRASFEAELTAWRERLRNEPTGWVIRIAGP